MQKKHDHVFHRVIAKAQRLGIYDLIGMYQEWDMELVAQFCATAWRNGNGYEQTLNFSIESHRFELRVTELPTIFALANNDFHRVEIITEWIIAENELAPLYFLGNEHSFGTTHGLLPEYTIFNNIFRNTLTPKTGDRTNIRGSTRNLLLAIVDDEAPPYIAIFFWTEMWNMLTHGAQYVIYAPYIQMIINYKTDMEFVYDGKHVAYQPHIVRTPAVPPASQPTAAAMGTSVIAQNSPPAHAHAPPPRRHAPLDALESSRAATHQDKKPNILVKGLKILISICRSKEALILESHQQINQRLSRLEERQREISSSMGFEVPEPIVYHPLPPPVLEDPWAWYCNAEGNDEDDDDDVDEIREESE
jgi:hypothetical protein